MSFNQSEARLKLREHIPFNSGSLRGRLFPDGRYEVYSYATLIARSLGGSTEILPASLSPSRTTTRHRNTVEAVWGSRSADGIVSTELGGDADATAALRRRIATANLERDWSYLPQ